MSLKKLYERACKYIESVDRYAILRGALLFFVFITAMTYGVLVMSFRQNKQEALRTLSESAAQSAAKLTASIRVGADRVCAAADILARFGEKTDERALSLLRTNENDSLFSIFAVRLSDGTSLLCDGRIISNVDWTEETAAFGSESPVTVSSRSVSALDGKDIFRIFAPINADEKNGGETRVYGVVETEKLSHSFHSSGFGGQSALLLFESNSGNILMNTADWLDFGGSFMGGKLKYAKGFSGEGLYRDFIAGKNGYTVIEDDSENLVCAYLPVGISDWYIMQLVPEKTLYSEAMKNRYALFASFAFAVIGMILFVLWTNGRVARLKKNDESSKYQAEMRNRILASALAETSTRVFLYYRQSDELIVIKSDSTVNASSRRISDGLKHICEYEGLSGDDARKLRNSLALTGNGNTVKFTLCSRRTGKNVFLRYTLSGAKDENGDGSVIIGTARDITEDETERRRQIDLERFRSSVVTYKTTGLEILLERNRWRFVWNNEAYFIKAGLVNEMRANYDSDL